MRNVFRAFTALAAGLLLVGAGCGGSAALPADAQSSPEKVVQAFYDVYVHDPEAAMALIDPEAREGSRIQHTLEEMAEWTIEQAEVVGTNGDYVEVKFTVTVDGDMETGTDEATVMEKDGKWWIIDLPS